KPKQARQPSKPITATHTRTMIRTLVLLAAVRFITRRMGGSRSGDYSVNGATGNEPRTNSFSDRDSTAASVFFTLESSWCPSHSRKNTYSPTPDEYGNDSIQVRFTLFCLNRFRMSASDPGLCGIMNMIAVLSLPVLPASCGPITANRVSLCGES